MNLRLISVLHLISLIEIVTLYRVLTPHTFAREEAISFPFYK
nr:MAG TPA: hypothetical protein [Caudoviricetes sp.]